MTTLVHERLALDEHGCRTAEVEEVRAIAGDTLSIHLWVLTLIETEGQGLQDMVAMWMAMHGPDRHLEAMPTAAEEQNMNTVTSSHRDDIGPQNEVRL